MDTRVRTLDGPVWKALKALKILWQVAALNGKKEEGEKLTVEVGTERDYYGLEQEPFSCLFPCSQANVTSNVPSELL